MRTRFFLNFNPRSGTARAAFVDRLVDGLAAAGATVERASAPSPEAARAEAEAAARSGQFDAIIAAGGDGTVRQAAAAAAGTTCPVGAVMLGTGNVLAHELTLPRAPDDLVALLTSGPTTEIELGMVNGDPFLLMVGVGFDGRVVGQLDHAVKQRFAKAAYVPATLRALRHGPDDLHVEIDGHRHGDVAWIIVTNAGRYGGAFRLSGATDIRRPGLVAYLMSARSKLDLVRHAAMLARGQLDTLATLGHCGVRAIACSDVRVTSARPVPVQVDGDDFGSTPVDIRRGHSRVRLIAPGG